VLRVADEVDAQAMKVLKGRDEDIQGQLDFILPGVRNQSIQGFMALSLSFRLPLNCLTFAG
jgi:hypothetical protein